MDASNPRNARDLGEYYEERGIGAWLRRNPWLLMRLFMVMVFTFGASTTAANFSYGLQENLVALSVEQINQGKLPPGTQLGDYVEITGTPTLDHNPRRVGTPDSEIAFTSRYQTPYFYFGLKETGDNLLIQTVQTLPNFDQNGERVWRGKLSSVGTVIFHDTTQDGLKQAGLPRDGSIPVIETGDTPQFYRQTFPAYSAIIGIWLLSIVWLVWKKNKPLLGV